MRRTGAEQMLKNRSAQPLCSSSSLQIDSSSWLATSREQCPSKHSSSSSLSISSAAIRDKTVSSTREPYSEHTIRRKGAPRAVPSPLGCCSPCRNITLLCGGSSVSSFSTVPLHLRSHAYRNSCPLISLNAFSSSCLLSSSASCTSAPAVAWGTGF